jgi:peptide-methionine (S)-S-oxide reductase|tara:strand:- start:776 stop:1306 length:531 start_codon:yes stop_codon:yes gene_type:complete
MENSKFETATFGGGCFWCTEAIFEEINGIIDIKSGFSGGTVPGKPTYREVCSGLTGHAEVIQLKFDPELISFKNIISIFMTTHDPTTLNRQGADCGTEYRSIILYHDMIQKQVSELVINEMGQYYKDNIVTEISPYKIFYEADLEHQDYYKNNKGNRYCNIVIEPKLAKLRQLFRK